MTVRHYALLVRWPDGRLEQHEIPPVSEFIGEPGLPVITIGHPLDPAASAVPMVNERGTVIGQLVVHTAGPGPEWMVARYLPGHPAVMPCSGSGSPMPQHFLPYGPPPFIYDPEEKTEPDLSVPPVKVTPGLQLVNVLNLSPEAVANVSENDHRRIMALADYVTAHHVLEERLAALEDCRCWSERGRARTIVDHMRNALQVIIGNADYLCETVPDVVDLSVIGKDEPAAPSSSQPN